MPSLFVVEHGGASGKDKKLTFVQGLRGMRIHIGLSHGSDLVDKPAEYFFSNSVSISAERFDELKKDLKGGQIDLEAVTTDEGWGRERWLGPELDTQNETAAVTPSNGKKGAVSIDQGMWQPR